MRTSLPDELGCDYVSELSFAPSQNKEMEERIVDLHKTYKYTAGTHTHTRTHE